MKLLFRFLHQSVQTFFPIWNLLTSIDHLLSNNAMKIHYSLIKKGKKTDKKKSTRDHKFTILHLFSTAKCLHFFNTSNMKPFWGTASTASTQIKAASSLLRVPFAELPYKQQHQNETWIFSQMIWTDQAYFRHEFFLFVVFTPKTKPERFYGSLMKKQNNLALHTTCSKLKPWVPPEEFCNKPARITV